MGGLLRASIASRVRRSSWLLAAVIALIPMNQSRQEVFLERRAQQALVEPAGRKLVAQLVLLAAPPLFIPTKSTCSS